MHAYCVFHNAIILHNDFALVQVTNFPFLGRIHRSITTMKDSTFESKAYGKRVNKQISIEGRVQFDLLQVSTKGVHIYHVVGNFHVVVIFVIFEVELAVMKTFTHKKLMHTVI